AARDRGREARAGVARGASAHRRHRRPAQASSGGALRRTAAACRGRPRTRHEAEGDLRRRADGQPRLAVLQGRSRAAPARGRRVGADDRDGHPRRRCGSKGRPDPLPRGRQDRARPRRVDRGRGSRRHAGGELPVTRLALKGLLGRKVRAVLTALAIVLGVAMVSGSFVLTDTISKAFTSIFSSAYDNTDAVVSGKKLVDYSSSGNATVSPALLDTIRKQSGVEAAAGAVMDMAGDSTRAKLIGKDGNAITHSGAPTFGFGVDTSQPRFNPLKLEAGRWAAGPGEVVIDPETARNEHFQLGDSIGVAANGPTQTYKVVGVAKYGDVESLGGATFAVFTIPAAQKLLHIHGYTAISVAAKQGVSQDLLAGE